MTARTLDGAQLDEGDLSWTWHEDVDDEGQRGGWWACDRCDGIAHGDASRAAHECRTDCCQCGQRLRLDHSTNPPTWVTDADEKSAAFCHDSDDNTHVPECDQ